MYLVMDKGYMLSIENQTYVARRVQYDKDNISIIFYCDLMETSFTFEIKLVYNSVNFLICESPVNHKLSRPSELNKKVVYKSIFEFTKEVWSEELFHKKKNELLHTKFGFNKNQKLRVELIKLYRELLTLAIANIEKENEKYQVESLFM